MAAGLGLGSFTSGLMGGLSSGSTLGKLAGIDTSKTIGGKLLSGKLFGSENPLSNTIAGAAGVNSAVGAGALIGNNSAGGVTAMLDDGGDTSGGVGGMTSGLPVLGASLLGDKTSKDNSKSDGIWSHLSSLLGD